jgi:hypothetical protein
MPFSWLEFGISSSGYSGTLSFYGAFDLGGPWIPITLYLLSSLQGGDSASHTSATNTIIGGSVTFPFFWVPMDSYTSGTAQGAARFSQRGPAGFQLITLSAGLLDSFHKIGLTNNDGRQSLKIAPGKATDTVVQNFNGFLSHILIYDISAGTAQVTIWDNPAAASGNIIGIVPSGATVGQIVNCKALCASGIYVVGASTNPGMTVFFTPI